MAYSLSLASVSVASLVVLVATLAGVRHADAITPRQLVEVVDFGPPVIAPSGKHVAFRIEQASVERNTYDTVWYVQRMDGNALPVRVADGGPPLRDSAGLPTPTRAVWSPDEQWIYYRAALDGKTDVWRAAVDGSGAEPLTNDSADVRQFALSGDGRVLSYSVGATREQVVAAETAEYDRGIHFDETVPVGQNLFRSGLSADRLSTQRLGFWFDRVPLLATVPDRWKAIVLSTRERRELGAAEVPPRTLKPVDLKIADGDLWKIALEPRSSRVAFLSRVGERGGLRDPPNVELAVVPNRGGHHITRCVATECTGKSITGIQWRSSGDEVVFTVTDPDEGLAQSIYLWNVETMEVAAVVHSRGLLSGGRDRFSACGMSAEALACIAADADQPPRLERIDIDTGRREVLFQPNAAVMQDIADVRPVQLLKWSDGEGRQFTAQYFPAKRIGEGLPPLFVTYYRCLGYLRGGMGDEWPLATLADHGISALCINAAPYRLEATERYESARFAVESAVRLLAARGEIDGKRVGMGGLSFGTEATFWTMIHSDLITAASVSSPAISQMYYLLGSMKGDEFFSGLQRNWQLGNLEDTPKRWRQISPTANLDRINAPVLMQLSEQELVHTLDYSIPLVRNRKADVYVFPHEPHQKYQPRHKLAVYERNLDWFRFWLQDFEDNDPRKAEQYKRWREMRARIDQRATALSAP